MMNEQRRAAIQRTFWNPVYDRFAGLYDAVDWFTGNYTHSLRKHLLDYLPAPPVRLLEVGMGTGRLHAELAVNYEMAGVDLAPGMVEQTKQRLEARKLRSHLVVASVYHLPWPSKWFDATYATFAFSAFVEAKAAMREMVRVTKPGGTLIIVDAGDATDDNRMAWLLARTWEAMGDFMRDEAPMMEELGLEVHREDYGPWGCVHVTVGRLRSE